MHGKVFHRRRRRRQGTVGTAVQMFGPAPGGTCGETSAVAVGEPRHIGLIDGDHGNIEVLRGAQSAISQHERRSQVHHVGGELTEDPDHARLRDSQRQRAHLPGT